MTTANRCQTLAIVDARTDPRWMVPTIDQIRRGGRDGRFDLVSINGIARISDNRALIDEVAYNAGLAFAAHNNEQLIVVGPNEEAHAVLETLRRHPTIRSLIDEGLEVSTFDPSAPRRTDIRYAVGLCIDWRQYQDGLYESVQERLRLSEAPAILAMAGAGLDVHHSKPHRGEMFAQQVIEMARDCDLEELTLTMHFECAAADQVIPRFDSRGEEAAALHVRLRESTAWLRTRLQNTPAASILLRGALVDVNGERISHIIQVPLS